jgi:hypothetical protein
MTSDFLLEKLKKIEGFEDLSLEGSMILKRKLSKLNRRGWPI